MVIDIEKRKAYNKAYNQTPNGKKYNSIKKWKAQGIHVDDMQILYKWYAEATNCEECGAEFVGGKINRLTKCVDHCHKTKTNNFRAFLCNACNLNDKSSNTSGVPNVYFHNTKKRWFYERKINGKRIIKSFKTKLEAVNYKNEYENNL